MEAINSKIAKLLARSTSSNEHEAFLALSKAQELLAKHHLSLETFKTEVTLPSEEIIPTSTKSVS